jgi:hypothetical protein
MKAWAAGEREAGAAAIVHAISRVRIPMTDDPVRLSKFIS